MIKSSELSHQIKKISITKLHHSSFDPMSELKLIYFYTALVCLFQLAMASTEGNIITEQYLSRSRGRWLTYSYKMKSKGFCVNKVNSPRCCDYKHVTGHSKGEHRLNCIYSQYVYEESEECGKCGGSALTERQKSIYTACGCDNGRDNYTVVSNRLYYTLYREVTRCFTQCSHIIRAAAPHIPDAIAQLIAEFTTDHVCLGCNGTGYYYLVREGQTHRVQELATKPSDTPTLEQYKEHIKMRIVHCDGVTQDQRNAAVRNLDRLLEYVQESAMPKLAQRLCPSHLDLSPLMDGWIREPSEEDRSTRCKECDGRTAKIIHEPKRKNGGKWKPKMKYAGGYSEDGKPINESVAYKKFTFKACALCDATGTQLEWSTRIEKLWSSEGEELQKQVKFLSRFYKPEE